MTHPSLTALDIIYRLTQVTTIVLWILHFRWKLPIHLTVLLWVAMLNVPFESWIYSEANIGVKNVFNLANFASIIFSTTEF